MEAEADRRSGLDRRTPSVQERLDEIERGYQQRYQSNRALIEKFGRWTFAILAVLIVSQIALGALSVKALSDNGNQSDDIRNTVDSIQEQRAEAIWDQCRSQNFRHDKTVARLNGLVDAIENPARRLRAQQNVASTISLIDALAPVTDCKVLIADRFHLEGKPLDTLVARLEQVVGRQRPSKHELGLAAMP